MKVSPTKSTITRMGYTPRTINYTLVHDFKQEKKDSEPIVRLYFIQSSPPKVTVRLAFKLQQKAVFSSWRVEKRNKGVHFRTASLQ